MVVPGVLGRRGVLPPLGERDAMTVGIRPTPDRMFEIYIEGKLLAIASTHEDAVQAHAQMKAWWWSREKAT